MGADFSGYATKNDLLCADGKTIKGGAFKHQNMQKVPLVWQHQHGDPENVLGHALLENRNDGVYAYAYFNNTPKAEHARQMVEHGDVESLSIYANGLKKNGNDVIHGNIREVSLVLAGANPGAFIDNVYIRHGDDSLEPVDGESIIYTGLEISHSEPEIIQKTSGEKVMDPNNESLSHAEGEETVEDIFNTLDEKQKNVVYYIIGQAIEDAEGGGSDDSVKQYLDDPEFIQHAIQEGFANMARNVFEQSGSNDIAEDTLSHAQIQAIVNDAKQIGSFKDAFLAHAETYGIDNIDVLFPDAKSVTSAPDVVGRRVQWVAGILGGSKHSPFARIKSTSVDLTAEEARAKGYVKGNLKKEEIIKLAKRVTTPTTVYKKQKLDRDDIVDITDLDVVSWLKAEMRVMLDEEVARAILIGDGREVDDEDKIDEDHLRPIAYDDDFYAHQVNLPSNVSGEALVESILRARKYYKGTGTPTLYTTDDILTDLMLLKDKIGRRHYNTEAELAAALRVEKIEIVEVMESVPDILGIIVNIADYTVGADKGGQISMFDDFDIDYNQQKYLIETRISGALTKPKSAVVVKRTSGTTVTPTTPSFDAETNTITIPSVTGVEYYDVTSATEPGTLLAPGDKVITTTTDVEARPISGYNFPHNTDADWTFAYTA